MLIPSDCISKRMQMQKELNDLRETYLLPAFLKVAVVCRMIISEANGPPHDKTNKMASAQSDQSLRCPHEVSLGP